MRRFVQSLLALALLAALFALGASAVGNGTERAAMATGFHGILLRMEAANDGAAPGRKGA